MKYWKQPATIDGLNTLNHNTLGETLGIQFTAFDENSITAIMPVNNHTVQPFRVLHGGASVCLSETLGSIASTLCIDDLTAYTAVGVEINANHLKSAREGTIVTGICKPIRVGKTLHVWQTEIFDEKDNLVCISRLTVAIVPLR